METGPGTGAGEAEARDEASEGGGVAGSGRLKWVWLNVLEGSGQIFLPPVPAPDTSAKQGWQWAGLLSLHQAVLHIPNLDVIALYDRLCDEYIHTWAVEERPLWRREE